ncbi:bifunctional metallophosphatase/5'-nucleotidase [Bacteroidota bacterium]
MNIRYTALILWIVISSFVSCSQDPGGNGASATDLTIFIVNDQHGRLDNFAKIDHIVDAEKLKTNVILTCSGDIFSGNPVVDNYAEKGYPMIDVMNRVGFDISVIGNHEFDYGQAILTDRMAQVDFDWVCANVDMGSTGVPEPFEHLTISIDSLQVTFLGLLETNGNKTTTMPSTHPLRVQGLSFERPENVIAKYSNLKEQENSDLYIALTHLGHDGGEMFFGDYQLASEYPFFDLIIGGHSHRIIDTVVNNIPIFQTGAYLNYLGKIELSVADKKIKSISYELINLNTYSEYDQELKTLIDEYNNSPYLKEVIGYSHQYHEPYKVGCFYTDALKDVMNVDVAFLNSGGVRSFLDEGDITKREIFEIAPFGNGTVIYNMTVSDIKSFLRGSGSGFYYSGIQLEQVGIDIHVKDLNDNVISDDLFLTVGVNDFISAVHLDYFPATGNTQSLTTAETLIKYLETINDQVSYPDCVRYFRFQ